MSFKSVTTEYSYLCLNTQGFVTRDIREIITNRKDFKNKYLDYLDWFCDNCTEHKDVINFYNYYICHDSNGSISFKVYQCKYFDDHRPFSVTGFIRQYRNQLSQVKSARNV